MSVHQSNDKIVAILALCYKHWTSCPSGRVKFDRRKVRAGFTLVEAHVQSDLVEAPSVADKEIAGGGMLGPNNRPRSGHQTTGGERRRRSYGV